MPEKALESQAQKGLQNHPRGRKESKREMKDR
jgi:hypothetical protein